MNNGGFRKKENTIWKHLPFLIFLAAVLASALIFDFRTQRTFIFGDGASYYTFLPELFIDHKLGPFVKYPVGTAVLMAPFFLAAHLFALLLTPQAADGYSMIYQYAIAFAALFYCVAGLILLYRILQLYYHRMTAVIVCSCIYFGTMLPVYAAENASYSHAYAFAAVTFFLWLVLTGKDLAGRGYSFLLGICLGLIFLIRNTDVIIVLVYLLFGFGREGYRDRLKQIFNPLRLLINAAGFAAAVSLQLAYWKIQTGSFLTNSYSGETFQFALKPKIMEVLFSDAKGLFIFCPVLIFFLIGLFYMRKDHQRKEGDRTAGETGNTDRAGVLRDPGEIRLACILVFAVTVYLYAAWWCWWLGAVYGQRTFCDILGIFAIGMGAFFEAVFFGERVKSDIRVEGGSLSRSDKLAEMGSTERSRRLTESSSRTENAVPAKRSLRSAVKGAVCVLIILFVLHSQALIMGSQRGVINNNLSNWSQLQKALKNFYTAEYYHAEHWWKIRNGVNRFRVSRSYFLSQFPQHEDSSYVSGGEGWLLFGPYKELPAGDYTVAFHLALEDGAEIPEDGILGTVGVNSNAGAFNSADYQKEIRADDLTPVIENLIIEDGCEDFELQVYAAGAGLRIDSVEIRRL